jgi:hypothetical protein
MPSSPPQPALTAKHRKTHPMRAPVLALCAVFGLLLSAVLGRGTPEISAAEPKTTDRPTDWAFQSPGRPVPPKCPTDVCNNNPIDAFVLKQLTKHGLAPSPQADRLTLLRRAYFDLLGLPPPPEEIQRFARDDRPDAYDRLIDRLLALPQYGERWARHWLDVVRYADTGGFESDYLYPNAWQYCDYVIRSLNSDQPFDRFIQEQVAGDELWPEDAEAVTATGLYCIGPALAESAMVSNQLEYEWLTDAADTTGAAFLGLTFGCARCHDHKYDPITQKDYYAMQAIFAASDRPYPDKIRLQRIKSLNGLLSDAPVPKTLLDDPRCTLQTEERTGFHLFHRSQPLEIHRLRRGELSKPREVVGPAFPAFLTKKVSGPFFASRRAKLAQWLTSSENPLTARVLVNRVWGWHFGQAIVRTPNDFGAQGQPPTHPELLDWLAHDFMDHGWSLKRLHRRIMLSSTYQRQSIASAPSMQVDPENRLLGHFPRHRLEGEALRDNMLACAGNLNLKPFGRPVVPPLSSQELTGLFDAKGKWPITKAVAEHTRRSVYLLVRRTFVYPFFAAFDSPELMTSCPRRTQTVVPAQALTLLNSPLAREQARTFARRLLRECRDRPQDLVTRAWLLAFGRPITPAEKEHARTFLRTRTAALARKNAAFDASFASPREAALAELCLALFNTNEFAYVD